MHVKAHITYDDHDSTRAIAYIHPASQESVDSVLEASKDDPDGRSNWVWLRLPNDDLILGIFPQGDTYLACELDAQYPRS